MDGYNFAFAFCLTLYQCGYDTYHAERLLKEFFETYGIAA